MNPREDNAALFTPFWPLCMMAASLAVFLGWQMTAAARQYVSLLRLGEQQDMLTEQAAQAETKLQAVMMDLLEMSRTDADAKAIVSKYGIKFNPSAASVPATDASSLPLEQPKPESREGAVAPPAEEPGISEPGPGQ